MWRANEQVSRPIDAVKFAYMKIVFCVSGNAREKRLHSLVGHFPRAGILEGQR